MSARVSNGDGMEVLAPALFAVKLSLLPSSTFHEGPPDCKILHFSRTKIMVSYLQHMPLHRRKEVKESRKRDKICYRKVLTFRRLSKTLCILYIEKKETVVRDYYEKVTKETEASAASARISAQDTTPGHEVSRVLLMLSTTSNPRAELALGTAVFSLSVMLPPTSSKMDPSQP